MIKEVDVIVVGAGAAGLMCAIEAGKRKRQVLVLEGANKPGKKILMSGGGRCNFTNYHINPDNYISHNRHFCKSALSRYTQWDFIEMVKRHRIPFHEKTLGQLFCDEKSQAILTMLLSECDEAGVSIQINQKIITIEKISDLHFIVKTPQAVYRCESLVIASGGLSIPTMGASPFGYHVAEQFNIHLWPTRAGLVPFTLHVEDKEQLAPLSGIGVDSIISNEKIQFREDMLFTHRGLSGPAILQISSYWQPGEEVRMNLLPDCNLYDLLKAAKSSHPQKQLKTILSEYLPKRLVDVLIADDVMQGQIAGLPDRQLEKIAAAIQDWRIKPNGTEGYRTAEVTLGGVDCDAISSKTMMANEVSGLYFIGEVVDVTGWLGGYNFQWAWSSGWAAGQVV